MIDQEQLEVQLKNVIIDTLGLDDVRPQDIDSDQPLFGDGLGLDSVDALELGIALKKRYGIVVDPKSEDTRSHFQSVRALARLVAGRDNETSTTV